MSLTHTLEVAASVKKANPTRNRVGFCAIHEKLISFRTYSITYYLKRSNKKEAGMSFPYYLEFDRILLQTH
ncbi:hypothetical protein EL540_14750 [Enterococcus faecalis]|uniref:Uncharacterized protein n=1 Tax=Enterococcus faecalis TaxID=1351 RepID=A0A4U3KV42_ENTFL|nr:hypothetical protein [Enterococcus faecalis]EGO8435381.1 hypothetical protein [Enterococcus faecalis]EGO8515132.1 hypothetical protein [Enterococcus faecalis]EGO9178784.1 hypothetical protein [Enterococcus faecalis]EGO9405951.1 hypothetical protein [Enterococcus faecalis]